MPRLKLTISYDGSSFAGWQSQKHGKTIQDRLEQAIAQIAGERLVVHGAGRTDAGVHALAQCAHVELRASTLLPNEWKRALNALLPPQIRIVRATSVGNDFHARFSVRAKTYRYRIWTGPFLPPFEIGRAWHVTKSLDLEKLRRATRLFIGRHDFAGFAANRGKAETSTVRTISSARMRKSGRLLTIEFTGDGFLYKMVRMMIGAIVDCGSGKTSMRAMRQRLVTASRSDSARLVAPADGLILVRIQY
jgi:tRNA pseudouridine38-40 synthase